MGINITIVVISYIHILRRTVTFLNYFWMYSWKCEFILYTYFYCVPRILYNLIVKEQRFDNYILIIITSFMHNRTCFDTINLKENIQDHVILFEVMSPALPIMIRIYIIISVNIWEKEKISFFSGNTFWLPTNISLF